MIHYITLPITYRHPCTTYNFAYARRSDAVSRFVDTIIQHTRILYINNICLPWTSEQYVKLRFGNFNFPVFSIIVRHIRTCSVTHAHLNRVYLRIPRTEFGTYFLLRLSLEEPFDTGHFSRIDFLSRNSKRAIPMDRADLELSWLFTTSNYATFSMRESIARDRRFGTELCVLKWRKTDGFVFGNVWWHVHCVPGEFGPT